MSEEKVQTNWKLVDALAENRAKNKLDRMRREAGDFNPLQAFRAFQKRHGHVVWTKTGIWLFNREAGLYERKDDEDVEALVTRWFGESKTYRHLLESVQFVKNVSALMKLMRTTYPGKVTPPFFTDGRDGTGWLVFANGRLNVVEAAKRYADGEPLPTKPEAGSGTFEPNDDTLVTDAALDIDWKPGERREFAAWLEQIAPDEDTRKMILMMMGLALSGDRSRKVFFTVCGQPNTAKSTLRRMLEGALGEGNVKPMLWGDFEKDNPRSKLAEALVVVIDDSAKPPTETQLNELLNVAGGKGRVTYKRVYRDATDAPIRALVVSFMNRRDAYNVPSQALRNRERVIVLTRVFEGANAVDKIEEGILARERAGILAAMVEGYGELLKWSREAHDPTFPQLGYGAQRKEELALEEDAAATFLKQSKYRLVPGSGRWTWDYDIFAEYVQYLRDKGLVTPEGGADAEDSARQRKLQDKSRFTQAVNAYFCLPPTRTMKWAGGKQHRVFMDVVRIDDTDGGDTGQSVAEAGGQNGHGDRPDDADGVVDAEAGGGGPL